MDEISTMFQYVDSLIARARTAQEKIGDYTQEQADRLVKAVARATTEPENVKKIGTMCFEEGGMGDLESKFVKLNTRVKGVCWDIRNDKTVGVIEEIPERGLVKVARPVGVIACLIPSTQPDVTAIIKAMFSLKGRNASVHAPHPKLKKSTLLTCDIMRAALKKHGAPEDLIICAEDPTIPMTNELMMKADLVIATGGAPMVRAAYSSGTPAYGAGAGNANVIIDETADIPATATLLVNSKFFDHSSGCSCENSIVVHESVYDNLINSMIENGSYMVSPGQKKLLQKAMWPQWPSNHNLNRDIVVKPATTIAKVAGFPVPEGTKLLLVEEQGTGAKYAFAGEKLCPVLAVYKYSDFDDAIRIVVANQEYQGRGHSCGIHTMRDDRIMKVAQTVKTTRVAVRQAMTASNSGSWTSGNNWTSTLGCGTWAGNIVSENITTKHFINTTWISRPIPAYIPTDEELFGDLAGG